MRICKECRKCTKCDRISNRRFRQRQGRIVCSDCASLREKANKWVLDVGIRKATMGLIDPCLLCCFGMYEIKDPLTGESWSDACLRKSGDIGVWLKGFGY